MKFEQRMSQQQKQVQKLAMTQRASTIHSNFTI